MSLLQNCTVRNATEMICPVPYIDLPYELMEANSSWSKDDSAASASRRRRDTGWQLLDRLWNLVRQGRWYWSGHPLSRQKRAPVASIRNLNSSMSLYLGFVMNKLTSLRNISKTKPHLRLELIPFNFHCDQTPVTFDPTVNPLIKIKVVQYFCLLFLFIYPRYIVFILISLYTSI